MPARPVIIVFSGQALIVQYLTLIEKMILTEDRVVYQGV